MAGPASLVNVVETIRIAVAPVFLLTGLGALLSVTTGGSPASSTGHAYWEVRRGKITLRLSELSYALFPSGSG
jgi:hypothetical protein